MAVLVQPAEAESPQFSYNPKRARPQLIALRETQSIDLAEHGVKVCAVATVLLTVSDLSLLCRACRTCK